MTRFSIAVLFCITAVVTASDGENPKQAGRFSGKLSALREDGGFLGKEWELRPGMVIDDFQNPPEYDADTNQLRDTVIQQFRPLGVIACGDIAYMMKGTLNLVTLKVFVFDSVEAARAWRKKKYEYEGWEKHYRKVDDLGDDALDSVQTSKRIVFSGNVWMTCHQLHQGDEYKKVIDHFLRKIVAGGASGAKE